MPYPVLASSSTLDIAAPVDLLAGSAELVTNRAIVGAAAVVQYQVVALAADNTLVAYDTAATEPQTPVITAVAAAANANCPYYVGGDFNHEKLVWPDGVTTLAARKAIFAAQDNIQISTILK